MVDTLPWHSRAWVALAGALSPRRGVVAHHFARMSHDRDYREGVLIALRAQGYREAESTGTSTPFRATGAMWSADANDLTRLHLRKLRERARELERDDPIASGIVSTFVRNVVGSGIEDRAATGDRLVDDDVDFVWRTLRDDLFPAERVTWFEAQRILMARLLVDGDVFVKRSSAPPTGAFASGMGFYEIVEADRVSTPLGVVSVLPQGGYVREGVERDVYGRIVAYWVAKRHPGDSLLPGSQMPPTTVKDYERVPASEVWHLRSPSRPGQSRSPSAFHSVLSTLRDLDLLVIAVLKRVQVAASFAVFLETSADVPDLSPMTAQKFHYQLDQDLVPGMIFVLRAGEKATTLNPNFPLPDLDVFVRLLARRIGAALGVSWQVVLADYSESSFASQRADRIEAETSYALPQQRIMDCLRWIRRGVLEEASLRGELDVDMDLLGQTTMIPPRKKWVDPKAQADADAVDLGLGLACRRDLAAERGRDWEDILVQKLREMQREVELRLEMGLAPLVPDSSKTGDNSVGAAAGGPAAAAALANIEDEATAISAKAAGAASGSSGYGGSRPGRQAKTGSRPGGRRPRPVFTGSVESGSAA